MTQHIIVATDQSSTFDVLKTLKEKEKILSFEEEPENVIWERLGEKPTNLSMGVHVNWEKTLTNLSGKYSLAIAHRGGFGLFSQEDLVDWQWKNRVKVFFELIGYDCKVAIHKAIIPDANESPANQG